MNSRTLRTGAFALVSALLLSHAAFAEQPARSAGGFGLEPDSETIDIAGLDLSSRAGAQRLYRQIVSAARRICSTPLDGAKGVRYLALERLSVRPCLDHAVDGSLADVREQTGTNLERVAGLNRFVEAGLIVSR
jgi:UrcA family protein